MTALAQIGDRGDVMAITAKSKNISILEDLTNIMTIPSAVSASSATATPSYNVVTL